MACLAALTISAPVPEADPDAFVNLGAVAIPAITGSALIDGLLLGKVAFLKGKLLPRLKVSTQFRGNFYNIQTRHRSTLLEFLLLRTIVLSSDKDAMFKHLFMIVC